MFCRGAKSILLVGLLACLFVPAQTQLPQWFGQLGNLNGNLSGISANTTLSELLKQLNSTEWQRVLAAFGGVNSYSSPYLTPTQLSNLGKCGEDLQRIMNNSAEMLQCKFSAFYNYVCMHIIDRISLVDCRIFRRFCLLWV